MANKTIGDLTEQTSGFDKDDLLEVQTVGGNSRKIKVQNSIAGRVPVLTDGTRGAAGNQGRVIFNTTDMKLNIDDGTNWTLPDGTTT